MADWLLLTTLVYFVNWRIPLAENIATTLIGFVVIAIYLWRWSDPFARSMDADHCAPLSDRHRLEGLLLLGAGILLLIPGVLTDVVGLVMLLPWVRRQIASRFLLND